ncbi:putative c6 transcription protein [Botrytis cinerea BcDW1]|uniref:Putative c6 transcription protein n=1 Tax=Botryotinia fuckeliana (strain BcDW1) TaxID=1290391 RepID=M7TMA8_BOTF1|nr:putative c6 transcription protein [Botrytis cinerea BcDW1]
MGNEYRSLKGCWTCRVRKRKCDEKVPICSACRSLELECHGYEEQPIWMDRGSRQKAEAMKIKQMVAEVRRRRRRRESSSENSLSLKNPRTNSHSRHSSLNSTFVTTPTTTQRYSWGLEAVFPSHSAASSHSDGSDYDFAPLNDDALSDFLPTDLFFPEPQALSHEIELLHSNSYTFECDLVSSPNIQLQTNKVARPQPANVLELMSGSGHSSQKIYPVISNKSALAIDKLGDATILAYYFEKVFNWQFLSCQSHLSAFNQGHIMWLVSKSQPLYHATLALSSSHKYLQTNITIDEHTPQYDVAIKELHNELQDPKSYEDVSILACIVMFLHSALLYKSVNSDWCLHLQAGISIVTSWIDNQDQHYAFGSSYAEDTDAESSTIKSAKVFLVGCIIRFDLLSSLTRNSVPALNKRYQQFLHAPSYSSPLQAALQCRSWLFSILLDVYSLREWKEGKEVKGLLSLRELVSKAFPIKKTLERGISLNMEEINNFKQSPESIEQSTNTKPQQPSYNILVVTHIFACSVSIFLEVVLSGALPKLPEIQHEVNRALESYAYINDPDLLNVLRWPLCVAASVAEPDQYDFFRSLLASPNVAWIGTFRQSLERLEEWWRLSLDAKYTDASVESARSRKFMAWDILVS